MPRAYDILLIIISIFNILTIADFLLIFVFVYILYLLITEDRYKVRDIFRKRVGKREEENKFKIRRIFLIPLALVEIFINRIVSHYLFLPVFWVPFSIAITLLLIEREILLLDKPAPIIYFATLLALLWSTRETMILRQSSEKQIRMQLQQNRDTTEPYLRLQFREYKIEDSSDKDNQKETANLEIVNDGKSIAVNVELFFELNGEISHEYLIKNIPLIKANGQTYLRSELITDKTNHTFKKVGERTIQSTNSPNYITRHAEAFGESWGIHAIFNDKGGNKYHAFFSYNPNYHDGFEIIPIEQRMEENVHNKNCPKTDLHNK